MENGRTEWQERGFSRGLGGAGRNLKVGLKGGATLSAVLGTEEPESRSSFHSEVCEEWRWHAPARDSPWPPLCCVSPTPDTCTLGFTYLSGQPIFLSGAFANSWGTISYSRLVKDL